MMTVFDGTKFMARIIKPLTDKEIRNAKADKFPLRDGNGLSLEITDTGAKIWRFNYFKPFTQKRTNISLGKLSDMTLTQARAKREEYRQLLAKNIYLYYEYYARLPALSSPPYMFCREKGTKENPCFWNDIQAD